MEQISIQALQNLLTRLELPAADVGGAVRITGSDPVVPGRYRLGLAAATALAAQAAGITEIWKRRGGRPQTVEVDVRRAAIPGLRTGAYTLRGGRALKTPSAWESDVFFRTKDGRVIYILRHSLYHQHHARLLTFLDCTPSTDSIARAVSKWNAGDLEDAFAANRLMGVVARSRDEWLASPQGLHLRDKVPVEIEKLGDSDPEPFKPAARPLSDMRVLDMAHILAGPITTRMLAEQGADVLHVSSPLRLDPVSTIIDTGFGKRCSFIDLDSRDDVATLDRLIGSADVFAHSWRPGSLDRRGLSPAAVAAKRPGIIYVSISCYGYDGPWAERAGYDPHGQVASGYAAGEGSTQQPRLASTFWLNDYLAAYLAAAGVTSALLKRATIGGSYHVKVSLTAASMYVQQLGKLPEEFWPGGASGLTSLPPPAPEHLAVTSTPFGALEHPSPIAQYSETPARWDLPPEPEGASEPVWRMHSSS